MNRERKAVCLCLAVAVIAIAAAPRVPAQCTLERTITNPTGTEPPGLFGSEVAISGDILLAQARTLVDIGPSATAVLRIYQFDVPTGALIRAFDDPEAMLFSGFGGQIAISGNIIAVGATGASSDSALNYGKVHLFDAATGALLRTIENPPPIQGIHFGSAIAFYGSRIVISHNGAYSWGGAYLFDATTGALLHTFEKPAAEPYDQFASSVAMSENHILIGARGDDTEATDAGSAYLFDAATGALLRTIDNPAPAESDHFGTEVALSGDKAMVRKNTAAYIFDVSSGALLQTFNGTSTGVAVSGDRLLWGHFIQGIAYLYDMSTGSLLQTFNSPNPDSFDAFGTVAISKSHVLVGSYSDDAAGENSGTVYLYSCPPEPTSTPSPSASPTPSPTASVSASPSPSPSPTVSVSASLTPPIYPTRTDGHSHHTPHGHSPTPSPTPSPKGTPLVAPNAAAGWELYE